MMIDDDLGWAARAPADRPQGIPRGSRAGRGGGRPPQGARAVPHGPASSPSADAFPSLAEAATATTAAPDPTYHRCAGISGHVLHFTSHRPQPGNCRRLRPHDELCPETSWIFFKSPWLWHC